MSQPRMNIDARARSTASRTRRSSVGVDQERDAAAVAVRQQFSRSRSTPGKLTTCHVRQRRALPAGAGRGRFGALEGSNFVRLRVVIITEVRYGGVVVGRCLPQVRDRSGGGRVRRVQRAAPCRHVAVAQDRRQGAARARDGGGRIRGCLGGRYACPIRDRGPAGEERAGGGTPGPRRGRGSRSRGRGSPLPRPPPLRLPAIAAPGRGAGCPTAASPSEPVSAPVPVPVGVADGEGSSGLSGAQGFRKASTCGRGDFCERAPHAADPHAHPHDGEHGRRKRRRK